MPYFVHSKDVDFENHDILTVKRLISSYSSYNAKDYSTRAEAVRAMDAKTQKITFVPTRAEAQNWRAREEEKFTSGEYLPVPWGTKGYDNYPSHYCHMSIKRPGSVAYTKDEEHGILNRQTSMKPGRYLEQYYIKPGFCDRETAQDWIAECTAEFMSLKIARSTDEIIEVYLNGPNSCMSKDAEVFDGSEHPVSVYGESDLGVAYYGTLDNPSARAIVWPDRKIYGRLYGGQEVLGRLLRQYGYTTGEFTGARIRVIPSDHGRYIMPYLDIGDWVGWSKDRKWFIINGSEDAHIECKGTDGAYRPISYTTCAACDETFVEVEGRNYCEPCWELRFFLCSRCGDEKSRDEISRTDHGNSVCESCIEDFTQCGLDGCHTLFDHEMYPYSLRMRRERTNSTAFCRYHGENHSMCQTHRVPYEISGTGDGECDTCKEIREERDRAYNTLHEESAAWEGMVTSG